MSPITHAKVSAKADSPDTSLVRPSEWNDDHVGTWPAASVVNVPAGGIAATDVQAAINELDAEKAGIADAETILADWLFSARLTADGILTLGTAIELTISGGAITVTKSSHTVDTEGDAPADNLDNIFGGVDGMLLTLRSEDSTRDTTLRDGVGNLRLQGNFVLDNWHDRITLIWDTPANAWQEISRSNNV